MKGWRMATPAQQINVMEAIVTMLAVKFLRAQENNEYVFTQDELKGMLEHETVRLEMVNPQSPLTTDIRCALVTLEEAKKMMQQVKKVVDRTKKKREA